VTPEEKIVADIDEHGWHVMLVRGAVNDDEGPWSPHPPAQAAYEALFSYTIGLRQTFAHPELILVGEWSSAHPILNGVGELVREGARFAPGDTSDDVLEGYPARFGAVCEQCREECLTWASWAAGGEAFEALQLILPDAEGRWPDDPDYAGYPQPLLSS
jgi:uncharacterized protein DUF4262